MFLFVFAVLLATCLHRGVVVGQECPPVGLLFPRPNLAKSASFQKAAARLATTLDAAVNGSIRSGWDTPNVSFSVGFVARDQAKSDEPIWEYHHLAANRTNGTSSLSRHSQYMIGSISKAITVAVLLRSGVDLDDPITKYLPELSNGPSLIVWNNITLRALASHMAGIPPNGRWTLEPLLSTSTEESAVGLSEWYYLKNYSIPLGFPEFPDTEYLPCDVSGLNEACGQTGKLSSNFSNSKLPQNTFYLDLLFSLLAC
jgi:hypothetical protein